MLNDHFVIDTIVHAFNLEEDNFGFDHTAAIAEGIWGVTTLTPKEYALPRPAYMRDWDMEDTTNLLFVESDTDVAVYHPGTGRDGYLESSIFISLDSALLATKADGVIVFVVSAQGGYSPANSGLPFGDKMSALDLFKLPSHEIARAMIDSVGNIRTGSMIFSAKRVLEQAGYEVLVFHATGSGGQTMESFIADGLISGVLDLTTTELADELVGGILTAGRDRLTAAGLRGVPQVISLGALDMVNFGPPETVPEKFRSRRFYQHNPTVTLMRTTPEENDRLGKEIAEKASAARGPTCVLIPRRGVSAIDAEGKPFWWPEADAALFQSLRNWTSPQVELIELDLHINDSAFAEALASTLLGMIRR